MIFIEKVWDKKGLVSNPNAEPTGDSPGTKASMSLHRGNLNGVEDLRTVCALELIQ